MVFGNKAIKIRYNLIIPEVKVGTLEDYEKAGEHTIRVEMEPMDSYDTKNFSIDIETMVNALGCKVGEIDIIARDGAYLVFAEVKYRKNASYGMPQEAVNYAKQKKISQTAGYYLMIKHMQENVSVRFDVVSVLEDEVTVIKNAFPYCFG
jgi:putative endonuclease